MPTFTIKGIPEDLFKRLRRRAAEHRRSLNSEVLVCLDRVLRRQPIDAEALLTRADALRERLRLRPLTAARIRKARSVGRP